MELRSYLAAVSLAVSISACGGPRLALDEVRRELDGSRNLAGRNLSGLDLTGLDFRNAILRGAYFRDANLDGVDLTAADLSKSHLEKARLVGATLRGANLREAELERANLGAADLTGAILEDANLDEARLVGVTLVGANLRGASFVKADLRGAQLQGADLTNADLDEASLAGANLSDAVLVEAELEATNLQGASLVGAKLSRATLRKANLERARLDDADLRGANLAGANLQGASLQGARLEGAKIRGATTVGSEVTRQLPAPPSEALRAQLGTIGVVSGGAMAAGDIRSLDKRALAAQQGALFGMTTGPGTYGAFSTFFLIAAYGVFVPPLLVGSLGVMAVVGGIGAAVGAVTAEAPPAAMQDALLTLRSAAIELRLDDALQGEIMNTGSRLTRHPFVRLPAGTTFSGGAATYPPSPPSPVESVLETTLLGLALATDSYHEPPAVVLTVRIRLARTGAAVPEYESTLAHSSRKRPLAEWASEQGRPFQEELRQAARTLAERIVDELLLLHVP